jgi:hypothetical protein
LSGKDVLRSKGLHGEIVEKILPQFANALKKDGIISSYDRKTFKMPISEDVDTHYLPPLKIKPDCVLHLPDQRKVLVEIANPKDPKRFVGELIYAQLLGYHKEIDAVVIFVLQFPKDDKRPMRCIELRMALYDICEKQTHTHIITWNDSNREENYHNLKYFLTSKIHV